MRSQMTQTLRNYLSADLRQWFLSHKDGAGRLMAAGIPSRSLMTIRTGRCTEKFLFTYRSPIEKVTGLSVDKICVKAAKRDLWGDKDKLSAIITREDAVRELKRVAEGRLGEVQRQLKSGHGRKQFETFVADPDKLWTVRLKNVLAVLAQFSGRATVADRALAGEADTPFAGGHSERIANAVVTMLSSIANIADAALDPKKISPGTKLHVAFSAAKVFQKLGITHDVIREFREKRTLTGSGAEALQTVLNAFKL